MLAGLAQYPFARLDDWKADATARGIELIDLSLIHISEPTRRS